MNLSPKYVFMAGGRANRMGRGVKSVDKTKGLMKIPTPDGKSEETLIGRTLRLLRTIEKFDDSEILFCVGYKKELVESSYPTSQFLTTYDPDDPQDLVPALLDLVEATDDSQNLVIFLADAVWSKKALIHFLKVREDASIVLYHGKKTDYSDIYAIGINGGPGREMIRMVNREISLPVIAGEIRWKGHDKVPIRFSRASTMEQWLDLNKIRGKARIYQSAAVDDIDWDVDHSKISQGILRGVYGPD